MPLIRQERPLYRRLWNTGCKTGYCLLPCSDMVQTLVAGAATAPICGGSHGIYGDIGWLICRALATGQGDARGQKMPSGDFNGKLAAFLL